MPDIQLESRARSECSLWGELLRCNLNVGKDIAEYWRHMAEIQIAAFLAIAVPETPTRRRRKFRVIDGGKSDGPTFGDNYPIGDNHRCCVNSFGLPWYCI